MVKITATYRISGSCQRFLTMLARLDSSLAEAFEMARSCAGQSEVLESITIHGAPPDERVAP